MPFVKLDCGILNSTLWFERTAREIFITALLMAEPFETTVPLPQIAIGTLDLTGWSVPPGWYGFVASADIGILRRAGIDNEEGGKEALVSLGQPELSSRSQDYEGRRLVRVDGGFIVLNFIKYRERDATNADRSRRWRQRQKEERVRHVVGVTTRRVATKTDTIAEAEAEAEVQDQTPLDPLRDRFERFWKAYPRKTAKGAALKAWGKIKPSETMLDLMLAAVAEQRRTEQWTREHQRFVPHASTWLNQGRWDDEVPGAERSAAVEDYYAWHCPHDPRCAHRTACDIVSARGQRAS